MTALSRLSILLLVLLAFLFSPFLLLINKEAGYFAYKQLVYVSVADRFLKDDKPAGETLENLNGFVHHSLYTPPGMEIRDSDVFTDFVKGIAVCDQRVWAMVTLLLEKNIEGRMVMSRNRDSISMHSVLEVKIENRWLMFDPLYNSFFTGPENEQVSFNEACHGFEKKYRGQLFPFSSENTTELIEKSRNYFSENIYYPSPVSPVVYTLFSRSFPFYKRAIHSVIKSWYRVFGKYFSNKFQDAFLALHSNSIGMPSLFFNARNYELLGRDENALAAYEKFNHEPTENFKEDGIFFNAVLLFNIGKYAASANLFERLLREFPGSKWTGMVHYYFGMIAAHEKQYSVALNQFQRGISFYNELNPEVMNADQVKILSAIHSLQTHQH